MVFYIILTPISTTSGLWSTGNTRKYQQIDIYIYQCGITIRTNWETQLHISVQWRHCSTILFWNRSRDCSVYTILENEVLWCTCTCTPVQVFQRNWFLFCMYLFGVEVVKETAKSSPPKSKSTQAAIVWHPAMRGSRKGQRFAGLLIITKHWMLAW